MEAQKASVDVIDIQFNVVRGCRRLVCGAHVFGTIENALAATRWRKLLERLSDGEVTSGASTQPKSVLNVGINHAGLIRLDGGLARELSRFTAFAAGMDRRSHLLGDPPGIDWHAWKDRHVWIAISGEDMDAVDTRIREVLKLGDGLRLVVKDPRGEAIVRDGHWYEHFGFRDDVSATIVDGLPHRPDERRGGGKKDPDTGHWLPIATGELLLGYPNERREDVLVGLSENAQRFLRNGTFGVLRELRQDVSRFRRYLQEKATLHGVSPKLLAAKLIGRTEEGDSLVRPGEKWEFTYEEDPFGAACPVGAHVRRANPRLTGQHRLVRRGMPFGAVLPPDILDDDGVARGMYFVAFNASIESQFEFVQADWLNKSAGALPHSRDPLAGTSRASGLVPSSPLASGGRTLIEGDVQADRDPIVLVDVPEFVTCWGGQYYFMPSIDALREIGRKSLSVLEPESEP